MCLRLCNTSKDLRIQFQQQQKKKKKEIKNKMDFK